MKFEVRSIHTRYEDSEVTNVTVNFNGYNSNRGIHVNGSLEITPEEYESISGIEALEDRVRQFVVDEVSKPEEEKESGETE